MSAKKIKKVYNKAIKILLVTNSLIWLAVTMIGPFYAMFVEKIGGNVYDAGLTYGILCLVAGVVTYFSGKHSDSMVDNELILVAGYAIMGVGFLLYMFVDSMLALFAVQGILGFADAIYHPAFKSIFTKHMAKHATGKTWGAWEAVTYLAAALGAVLGGAIVGTFGFNTLFITMAVLCFISSAYIYILPREVL